MFIAINRHHWTAYMW